ncbi:hypothetical protein D3C80_1471200 [compost metagenome]
MVTLCSLVGMMPGNCSNTLGKRIKSVATMPFSLHREIKRRTARNTAFIPFAELQDFIPHMRQVVMIRSKSALATSSFLALRF